MINYNSNIKAVIKAKLDQIKALHDNPDPILRTVALTVLPELKHRVHVEGKDSSGNQIGIYSPGYMQVRTGNFANSKRVSRGVNKGKLKDAGTFTQGKRKSEARPRYNRTADTKVVASLTRQMENDLSVIPSGNGYGIGYLNPFNFQKSEWVEETYRKPILSKLTDAEKELARQTADQFTTEYLKN